ncbi:MAG: HD domain-containing protein [Candidatus Bathyarchaeota archaeon]|nr:HD domain-containing protein [Candidatus Bathyarchaeota archaeon]
MDPLLHVTRIAQQYFKDAKGSHDWDHTNRVLKLCIHIGSKEHADLEILRYAAILHDIGRKAQDQSNGNLCHAELSTRLARSILEKFQIDPVKIEKILHCIESHRYRGHITPNSKEAHILFDADKLDSIGAVGIGRAFLFAGEVGARLHNPHVDLDKSKPYTREDTAFREYQVKLRNVRDRILTKEGKRIANERHRFMVEYFNRLNKEVEGEL